jgi:hypothetical protein
MFLRKSLPQKYMPLVLDYCRKYNLTFVKVYMIETRDFGFAIITTKERNGNGILKIG